MASPSPSTKPSAEIIDGRAVAKRVRARVANAVDRLTECGIEPSLAVILIGEDPASAIYVRNKLRACKRVGIRSIERQLPESATTQTLPREIDSLNDDATVDGVLLQLPLPSQLDARELLARVDPLKDVDGYHPKNLGNLVTWGTPLQPCTPAGVIELLTDRGVALRGQNAVVIGRSALLGRPMAHLLLAHDATVTICHRHTSDLRGVVERADLVVSAAGVPGLIKGLWIKPGATVIDVAINRMPDNTLCGDVEFEVARNRASAITPVPGGVGPMTIAMLLRNTVIAARLRRGLAPDSEL